jgi:ubiquitin-like modifier-activating enzyme 5
MSELQDVQKLIDGYKEKLRFYEQKLGDLEQKTTLSRPKISGMSDVVVDSNPYSRLMALKRMGIVKNYEVYIQRSVIIIS